MTDKSIMLFCLLLAVAIWVVVGLTSCATLESIPFSVSYQTRDGATVTISKPIIIHEK